MPIGEHGLPGYEILEQVGRGGFSTVYRASDLAHDRLVAIKVLDGALGSDERRRFDRERKAVGRLANHPNVVPVFESGYSEDGEAFMVLEYEPGGSLGDRLKTGGPMPWPEASRIVQDIARAVEVAHSYGIRHRDIKPENILVDEYGTPKLADFGIATVSTGAATTGLNSATLAHAAPEILEGQPATDAVDVYALGSTLHCLIAGSPAFERSADQGVAPLIRRVLVEEPPPLEQKGVPTELADVVRKAMAKRPTDRHVSVSAFRTALLGAAAAGQDESAGDAATAAVPPISAVVAAQSAAAPQAETTQLDEATEILPGAEEPVSDVVDLDPVALSQAETSRLADATSVVPDDLSRKTTGRNSAAGGGQNPIDNRRAWWITVAAVSAVIAVIAVVQFSRDSPNASASRDTEQDLAQPSTSTTTTGVEITTSATSALAPSTTANTASPSSLESVPPTSSSAATPAVGRLIPAVCDMGPSVYVDRQHPDNDAPNNRIAEITNEIRGDVDGDGYDETIVETFCSFSGTAGTSDQFLFDNDDIFLTSIYTRPVLDENYPDYDKLAVHLDGIALDGNILMTILLWAPGDPNCCPSLDVPLFGRWNPNTRQVDITFERIED